MLGLGAAPTTIWFSPPVASATLNSNPGNGNCFPGKVPSPAVASLHNPSVSTVSLSSTFPLRFTLQKGSNFLTHLSPRASSSSLVGSAKYSEEPATSVKFQTSLKVPGCSSLMSLLGTGYREKVFVIVGVKVYAVGLYVNQSVFNELDARKGQTAAELQADSSLFDSIFKASSEKSLQIVLVRDVDGKTFWDALDEAVSPRIKAPTPADASALHAFRKIFQGRSLKKGTIILLTWPDPSKMLVCVSSGGLPSSVDAAIESANVASALFYVFFGDAPVSPSLKASVANRLGTALK